MANMFFYAACLLYFGAIGAHGRQCYRTVHVRSQGEKLGTHQAIDCKENSLCMLAEVHLTVDYTPATVYVGFCFPKSEVDTTACKDVLTNMGEINAVGAEHGDLHSCRLSFCDDDLCNDMNGPPLPEHFPTATAVGEPIECYAIEKTTTSLGVGNKNYVNKVTCRAGASCFLSKMTARARSTYRNFDIDGTAGGCRLAFLCDYDECKWAQGDVEGLVPSYLHVAVTMKSCASACCNGSLCNDANADIFSPTPADVSVKHSQSTSDSPRSSTQVEGEARYRGTSLSDTTYVHQESSSESGESFPVAVVVGSVVLLLVISLVLVALIKCNRPKQVSFTPGTMNQYVKA